MKVLVTSIAKEYAPRTSDDWSPVKYLPLDFVAYQYRVASYPERATDD